MNNNFNYYYGIQAEQFAFYRVPRLLIKDKRFKGLSSDAKLLYGLMLDRMSLSMKNGWLDDENRVYIVYTLDNVMEDLGCARATCVKIMKELIEIGLIEKKRQGCGRPDIIYVKNFADLEIDEKDFEKKIDDNAHFTEVQKPNFKKSNICTSRSSKTEFQEVQNLNPNYTNINYTDISYNNPINQSEDKIDEIDNANAYMEIIRENIEYEHHMKYAQYSERDLYQELYEIICDVVCVKRKTIRISGDEYPYQLVKSKFLKLNSSHLDYVISCMQNTTTKINNIKAYMVTALYNAPSTIDHYYQQEVRHDMYGG